MVLTTLPGVLNEQTRVYRLMLNDRLTADIASKMLNMLDRIRASVEAMPPEPEILIGSGTVINVLSVANGHYITAAAIERMAKWRIDVGHRSKRSIRTARDRTCANCNRASTDAHREDRSASLGGSGDDEDAAAPETTETLISAYAELASGVDDGDAQAEPSNTPDASV